MNTISVKKSTSLRIDQELYAYIEKLAKKENRSVNNYIETVLTKATNFRMPNSETVEAIEEARSERGSLERFSDGDSLINSIR
ncbi:MAG: hypothetical protein RIC06_20910 [Cyclobacteriaceae bacterium]